MRLIDADKLMEFAKNHINHSINCNDIARFPTVDAAPVRHGRWNTSLDGITPFCTACGMKHRITNFSKIPNYCPNCGAKMDGGAET